MNIIFIICLILMFILFGHFTEDILATTMFTLIIGVLLMLFFGFFVSVTSEPRDAPITIVGTTYTDKAAYVVFRESLESESEKDGGVSSKEYSQAYSDVYTVNLLKSGQAKAYVRRNVATHEFLFFSSPYFFDNSTVIISEPLNAL